jgi:hypothetical protein
LFNEFSFINRYIKYLEFENPASTLPFAVAIGDHSKLIDHYIGEGQYKFVKIFFESCKGYFKTYFVLEMRLLLLQRMLKEILRHLKRKTI